MFGLDLKYQIVIWTHKKANIDSRNGSLEVFKVAFLSCTAAIKSYGCVISFVLALHLTLHLTPRLTPHLAGGEGGGASGGRKRRRRPAPAGWEAWGHRPPLPSLHTAGQIGWTGTVLSC